jgi:hypothetical protein
VHRSSAAKKARVIAGGGSTRVRALLAKAALVIGTVLVASDFALALTCVVWLKHEVREGKVYLLSAEGSKELPGIDAATFRVFPDRGASMMRCVVNRYAADRNTVLFDGEPIKDADPATFEVIDGGTYAKDRNRVYSDGTSISLAVSAVQVVGGYATDGNRGFYDGKQLPGDRFIVFDGGTYAKSSVGAFWFGRAIEGVDAASFEVIQPLASYAKDKSHVYYEGRRIRADPRMFRQIYGHYFRDARAVYLAGREIADADPATFEALTLPYSKDKNRVYYGDKSMAADAASFHARGVNRGSDKDYDYLFDKPICSHAANGDTGLKRCR